MVYGYQIKRGKWMSQLNKKDKKEYEYQIRENNG